jgi:hypothetical protein
VGFAFALLQGMGTGELRMPHAREKMAILSSSKLGFALLPSCKMDSSKHHYQTSYTS